MERVAKLLGWPRPLLLRKRVTVEQRRFRRNGVWKWRRRGGPRTTRRSRARNRTGQPAARFHAATPRQSDSLVETSRKTRHARRRPSGHGRPKPGPSVPLRGQWTRLYPRLALMLISFLFRESLFSSTVNNRASLQPRNGETITKYNIRISGFRWFCSLYANSGRFGFCSL